MRIKELIFKEQISFNIIIVLFGFLFFSSFSHPYYISVTEVRIDPAKKTINMSCKMFTDDMEAALGKSLHSSVSLFKGSAKNDSLLNIYVTKHTRVLVGNKEIAFKYIGYEIEEEAVWCYFESALSVVSKEVKIQNSILFDSHESQTNFIHCYYGVDRKSFKLVNPNNETVFSF